MTAGGSPAGAAPIGGREAAILFEKALRRIPISHERAPAEFRIILAVSGGPDSLALLLAAAAAEPFLKAKGIVARFLVATVDHALRAASADEAAFVARIAADRRFPHETLLWRHGPVRANVQGAAREARYGLLAEFARRRGAAAIMTAHHADDQLETHCLALARVAGDRGRAGMRVCREIDRDIWLVRPFLDIAKKRCEATVAEAGLCAVDDPGNYDPAFERVRVRRLLAKQAMDHQRLRRDMAESRRRVEALDRRLACFFETGRAEGWLRIGADGTIRYDRSALAECEEPLISEVVARSLVAAGGAIYPPGRDRLERLVAWLVEDASTPSRRTLSGTVVERAGNHVLFSREWGRNGLGSLPVEPGTQITCFDRRFDVDLSQASPAGCRLMLDGFGRTGRGNALERAMPALFDESGILIAAPEALSPKAGGHVAVLPVRERVGWRLMRDLQFGGALTPL